MSSSFCRLWLGGGWADCDTPWFLHFSTRCHFHQISSLAVTECWVERSWLKTIIPVWRQGGLRWSSWPCVVISPGQRIIRPHLGHKIPFIFLIKPEMWDQSSQTETSVEISSRAAPGDLGPDSGLSLCGPARQGGSSSSSSSSHENRNVTKSHVGHQGTPGEPGRQSTNEGYRVPTTFNSNIIHHFNNYIWKRF